MHNSQRQPTPPFQLSNSNLVIFCNKVAEETIDLVVSTEKERRQAALIDRTLPSPLLDLSRSQEKGLKEPWRRYKRMQIAGWRRVSPNLAREIIRSGTRFQGVKEKRGKEKRSVANINNATCVSGPCEWLPMLPRRERESRPTFLPSKDSSVTRRLVWEAKQRYPYRVVVFFYRVPSNR